MASMNTRLNIKKLDKNIVQKHGGSKQVGFKQLGPCVKTGVHGSHDHAAVDQRKSKVKQLKGKTNTDCLVNKQVHHGAHVGAVIMKTGVLGQKGVEGNAVERYRGDNNMDALRVAVVIEEYAHKSLTIRDAVACERNSDHSNIYYWKYAHGLRVRMVCQEIVMKKRRVRGHEYMTLTGKLKEDTWLKGLSIESRFELRLVAGIATCALTKVAPSLRFQHCWLKLPRIGEG
ncbi:hypothetical protein Tco_0228740 [Tanacetum coccineum]